MARSRSRRKHELEHLLMLGVITGGGAWSPLDIPGLTLWLDASDSATLFQDSAGTVPAVADSDVVGYWADKSGSGRHATQATTANKPVLKLAAINGRNALQFDSVNDVLASTGHALDVPATIFAVFRTGNVIADTYLCDGQPARFAVIMQPSNMVMYQNYDGSTALAPGNYTSRVGVFQFNALASFARLNGVQSANVNPGNISGMTDFYIGARFSSQYSLGGYIAELGLYNRALTAQEIAQIESYLNAKWGVY